MNPWTAIRNCVPFGKRGDELWAEFEPVYIRYRVFCENELVGMVGLFEGAHVYDVKPEHKWAFDFVRHVLSTRTDSEWGEVLTER